MTKGEYANYLQSPHWRETRKRRIAEGSSACERCAIPRWLAAIAYDQDLHVHHRTYASLGAEVFDDLEVLCRRCHDIESFGRSDLREPKTAECRGCCEKHWNPHSDLCSLCERLLDKDRVAAYMYVSFVCTESAPGGDSPLWSELMWMFSSCLRGTDQMREALSEIETKYSERSAQAALAQNECAAEVIF